MTEFAIHEAELTGALTDLLMGIVIIPLLVVLCLTKSSERRTKTWAVIFFSALCASCFLGYLAHNVFTDGTPNTVVWSVLLPLLYEDFASFFLFAVALFTRGNKPDTKLTVFAEAFVACALVVSLIVSPPYNDTHIRILVIAGGALALTGFVLIAVNAFRRFSIGERVMISSLILLLPAAYFQVSRKAFIHCIWYFDCNGIAHILIMLGIIAVFVGVLVCLRRKTDN